MNQKRGIKTLKEVRLISSNEKDEVVWRTYKSRKMIYDILSENINAQLDEYDARPENQPRSLSAQEAADRLSLIARWAQSNIIKEKNPDYRRSIQYMKLLDPDQEKILEFSAV